MSPPPMSQSYDSHAEAQLLRTSSSRNAIAMVAFQRSQVNVVIAAWLGLRSPQGLDSAV
jgi:hypothetical protein